MRLDSRLVMSDAQAITVDAASTSHIDLDASRDIGAGEPLWWCVWCSETFLTTVSIDFKLQSDSDSGFATNLVTHITQNVVLASLLTGTRLIAQRLPLGIQRYVRTYYDVNTNATAGKVTSTILHDIEVRTMYAKNYSV